ncbi:MAG: penicillin-binding protein [Bacteroidales bacterium]
MEQKSDILWRIRLIYFAMAIFALVIIGKVLYIQLVEGEYWKELSRSSTMRYVNIEANRGDICADDGRLLATSVPVYELRMDLSKEVISDQLFSDNIDSLAIRLSGLFGDRNVNQYRTDLVRARQNQERYYLVKRNVSWGQLQQARQFPIFRRGRFGGGLIVNERTRRQMPYQTLAARTIGYEREGIYVGLEGAYRQHLEGIQGKRLMQRLSGGTWMPISDQNEIRPQNGKDLITTINVEIQDITEKALLRQLERFSASHGTAVVMEVATGKIKAISNLQRNSTGTSYDETYNFAVGQSTEPGSTFKLATIIAALEDGVIGPDDHIDTGDGSITYYNRTMKDVNEEGYGNIPVREAFALSSNVGISQIIYHAYKDNPERFVERLRRLGLHEPLGLEISGEGQPVMRNPGSQGWSNLSLPWMAIGYEVSMTPLQTLTLYNSVANNGQMMKPMFVNEIRQAGRTVKEFSPTVLKRSIAGIRTIRMAQEMLAGVVENGTAANIRTDAYPIAGKTGTAQIAQAGQGYRGPSGTHYQASFAGYFPANDPVYSCIVMINDPRGYIYTGSQVAAPAFREIADKMYAAQLFIPPDTDQEVMTASLPGFRNGHLDDFRTIYSALDARIKEDTPESKWGRAITNADTIMIEDRTFIENLTPEVVGMGLRDAIYVLENAGLKVRFSGRGIVRRQSIPPGRRITPGNTIYLELS